MKFLLDQDSSVATLLSFLVASKFFVDADDLVFGVSVRFCFNFWVHIERSAKK